MSTKRAGILVTGICVGAIAVTFYAIGGLDLDRLREQINATGPVAPLAYVAVYLLVTMLVLPSTALNLLGGALFGVVWGTVWTTVAALVAALAGFYVSRRLARPSFERRLAGRWQTVDQELRRGAIAYFFALRLLPILPYGIANYAAGLTSVRFRDYAIGTLLGTVPGIVPFVWLGSAGATVVDRGELWPLLGSLALIGLLVVAAHWYRRRKD